MAPDLVTGLGALDEPFCLCRSCTRQRDPWELCSRMTLCPSCGNKRCPRASHHDNLCSGSNEPGQIGSDY